MLPKCNAVNLSTAVTSSTTTTTTTSSGVFKSLNNTMVCTSTNSASTKNTQHESQTRKFDFDLSVIERSDLNQGSATNLASAQVDTNQKKADLQIDLCEQPTLVIQSPKTPTLSRKLKAISLDSDSNTCETPAECLEVPRDTFSMPNTPKRQVPVKVQKFANKSMDTASNLSSYSSNQSISGSQTLKTLPEVMTLSDFGQGKCEPVRVKAKGLLERRGSNVSLTIDLCAAEAQKSHYRLNTARSVSNLNLTTSDKCKCIAADVKCECNPKRKDCRKCTSGGLKKFQKLSTESCLCDDNINNTTCQGYKVCQYSRLGCLNYLSYMRRKSLSNENLYLGPSYDYTKKVHKKSEYPRNVEASHFKNQILSEDFQLHLQNIQYLQTAGNVLSKKQLKDSCKMEHLKDLHKEFWELPQNFQEKSFVSGSQSKNRYKTILPNEHSRVVLDIGQMQDSSGGEGYINANYIKGYDYTETAYIATQGPLSHTTSDLWQMVVQSNAHKVIMLTPIEEKGRIKCDIYFPIHIHEHFQCGHFDIKCLHIQTEKSYTIRTLRIRDTSKKTSMIVNNSPKFCCDRMKQCGIECSKLATNNALNKPVLNQYESNQNSPKHLVSPRIINNNSFFNENFDDNALMDEDDDIFTNIEYKSVRIPLRPRDCKFSDDFTDILTLDDCSGNEQEQDDLLDTDHIVEHYWYETWPDHNLANTEEILALALDVLDLRYEAKCLFTECRRPSHLVKKKVDLVNCQRRNLAGGNKIATELTEFQTRINELKDQQQRFNQKNVKISSVPIVVHCSAGIGRTGCFLAILNGIQQLKHNCNVDVLAIVCALRLNRGGMVQTAEQYELIHKVLALYDAFYDEFMDKT